MNALHPVAAPLGRVMLAAIFVLSGINKIGGYEGTQQYMESAGVPGALLPLVILVEVGLGALVAIGLFTRLSALALAGFTVLSALIFHFDLGDQMQFIQFMKNLAIAGGFLMIFAIGPGAYAIDARNRA